MEKSDSDPDIFDSLSSESSIQLYGLSSPVNNVSPPLFDDSDVDDFSRDLGNVSPDLFDDEIETNRRSSNLFDDSESSFNDRARCSSNLFSDSEESDNKNSLQSIPIILNTDVNPASLSNRKQELINQIEEFTLQIITDIAKGKSIKIQIRCRNRFDNFYLENDILKLKPDAKVSEIKSPNKISIMLLMVSKIHKLLLQGKTCCKRQIYYEDTKRFQNSINVDLAVKDVCCLFDAHQWELGLMSSSKGLIAGPLKLTFLNGDILDCNAFARGCLIPYLTAQICQLQTDATFVLLVEKDTVFEKLLNLEILSKFNNQCILITGKGYPDINVRLILKKLWNNFQIPIYGLFDADPYGIDIMLVYRHGSRQMATSADELAVPSIKWIGVRPSDIEKFNLQTIDLTKYDELKIKKLIKRPYVKTSLYIELLHMEKLKKKAEIEALSDSQNDFLLNFLINSIHFE